MKKTFTVSILGCGSRGHYTYGKCMSDYFSDKFKIVSVCDTDPEKIALAQNVKVPVCVHLDHGTSLDMVYKALVSAKRALRKRLKTVSAKSIMIRICQKLVIWRRKRQ